MAEQAGYQVFEAEQLRPNRWQLIVIDGAESRWVLLVQARPLLSAADVQDLADIVRLRRLDGGILLAHGGVFSPAAVERGLSAADVVRDAAAIVGGGGGGKPEVAQAGGRHLDKVGDALKAAREAVRSGLGGGR